MSLVGQFPGISSKRKIVRAPVNPMDKATVVSIFPKEIFEVKPTIQPGRFIIPKGSEKVPAILVVGSSSWWREVDEDQPLLEIPQSAIQVADSIVRDYCVGLLGYNPEDASPGMFYVPGEYDLKGITTNFVKELQTAKHRQDKWYEVLVRLADSLWARSNGNPLAISEDMRMAARELGLDNKDWLKDFKGVDMVRCKACGGLKNPQYPVCGVCRNVDLSHSGAKDLKFAQ